MSSRHLNPDALAPVQGQAKRSHSCTPLLDVENGGKDRRRSSSVHTLLQIRRDSAKISEELANLTAQLSAAMGNGGSSSKRASLSVPTVKGMPDDDADDGTPTIDQLLAENNQNPSMVLAHGYLTVDSNTAAGLNPPHHQRGRS